MQDAKAGQLDEPLRGIEHRLQQVLPFEGAPDDCCSWRLLCEWKHQEKILSVSTDVDRHEEVLILIMA